MEIFQLAWIDYSVMIIYFVFVLGIGWFLRRHMKDASAFLEAGKSMPAWVAGLAFISTNLGALEVMGMTGSGAKYGMLTTHFYLIGAIPAMVFLALFMMPFYYGSKARSVPEYLKLRFDEKTRGLNAILFAVMTILASGISMYALALL
ncbi:MAG: sodium:solute symporter family transporter, partial [Bacteroidales bacterium]